MILQAQNPQTPKELYPLTPKFELDQETIRREIIENLIRFADFIGHPKAKK